MTEPIFELPPYTIHQRLLAADVPGVDWGLELVGVPDAWARGYRGRGIAVAVLDTGCDLNHPDLKNVSLSRNFTRSRYGAGDVQGHGTHCAGIIGASGKITGVAPECELFVGKVLGDDGAGDGEAIAAGVAWAVANDAQIISMSLGSPMQDPRILTAIRDAVAAGVIVVCAAGNDGRQRSVNWPAKMPEVIAISAIGKDGRIAEYSSRGPEVAFAAPGSEILSTINGGGYATLSGTSMATPFVAGLIALGLSANLIPTAKERTKQAVVARIRPFTRDAGAPGKDDDYGFGIVDLASLKQPTAPPPPVVVPAPAPMGGWKCEPMAVGGRLGVFVWSE